MKALFTTLLMLTLGALLYAGQQGHEAPGLLSIVSLACSAWFLEYRALGRKTLDFSCGFVFLLILTLSSSVAISWLCLAGCYCSRVAADKTKLTDLNTMLVPLALVSGLRLGNAWPQNAITSLVVALALLFLVHLILFHFPRALKERFGPEAAELLKLEEAELSVLRVLASSYALTGAVIPLEKAWLLSMAVPLCLLVHRGAENTVFRLQAQAAEKAKQKATKIQEQFSKTRAKLEVSSKKQRVLEDINRGFARAGSPEEGFRELARLLSQILTFRSVALIESSDAGPFLRYYLSPEKIENRVRDPDVLRAFQLQQPIRKRSSVNPGERLIQEEEHLLALAVLPLGVLYLGRTEEPFSKAESRRFLFLARRAFPALLQLMERAQTKEALEAKSLLGEQLQKKVGLSAKLLEAAQHLLTALTREQVFKLFETVLTHSLEHRSAIILLAKNQEPVWSWGEVDPGGSVEKLSFSEELKTDEKLAGGPLADLFPGCETLVSVPLRSERGTLGCLLLAFASAKPNLEELDFLATCSCLVGSSLNAIELSRRVKENEQRLTQASKMSAIGQLAASVAHELNTPLATISLAIQGALQNPNKAEKRLSKAQKSVARAQHIVSQLLEHSRHGDGKRELIVVEKLLEQVRELVGKELQKRGLRFVLNCEAMNEQILANPIDLEQVLTNLVLNAADASTREKEIQLRARKDGLEIEIEVLDSGTGIPEEIKSRVFEAFFTTKPAGQGTGLGLSVCRQLVNRHSGTLNFESEVGRGTRFFIRFPARS